MREEDLSHRGLMKLANAKLDYLINLIKIEEYERRFGNNTTDLSYKTRVEENYNNKCKEIFTKDKLIGER